MFIYLDIRVTSKSAHVQLGEEQPNKGAGLNSQSNPNCEVGHFWLLIV
jgi:hypothetical protein